MTSSCTATEISQRIPWFPVGESIGRIMKYHLGSVALGSFIVAMVKFARAVLKWVQSRLNGVTSGPLKVLLSALDCCFKLLER